MPCGRSSSSSQVCNLSFSTCRSLTVFDSLKSLTTIQFHRSDEATASASEATPNASSSKASADVEYVCPCCRKTLSNNVASFGKSIETVINVALINVRQHLPALKPCGHVLCVSLMALTRKPKMDTEVFRRTHAWKLWSSQIHRCGVRIVTRRYCRTRRSQLCR